MKSCSCGSGKPRYEQYDAAGIFLCFTCDSCHDDRMKRYRPSIFKSGTAYSASGEEDDIDIETFDDLPNHGDWAEPVGVKSPWSR